MSRHRKSDEIDAALRADPDYQELCELLSKQSGNKLDRSAAYLEGLNEGSREGMDTMKAEGRDALARILTLRAEGLSFEKIADRLDAEGIRNTAGGKFTRQSVRVWYERHRKGASQGSQASQTAEPSHALATEEKMPDDSQGSQSIATDDSVHPGSQSSHAIANEEKAVGDSQPSQSFATSSRRDEASQSSHAFAEKMSPSDDSQPSQSLSRDRGGGGPSQSSQRIAEHDGASQGSHGIASSGDHSQRSQPGATAIRSQVSQRIALPDGTTGSQPCEPSHSPIPCEWIAALRSMIREEINLASSANVAKDANAQTLPTPTRSRRRLKGERKTMSGTRIDAVLFDLFTAECERSEKGASELMQKILWEYFGRPKLSFERISTEPDNERKDQ